MMTLKRVTLLAFSKLWFSLNKLFYWLVVVPVACGVAILIGELVRLGIDKL
jgi:hypothetical protein